MAVATVVKNYIANMYCGGTTALDCVLDFNEDCALNKLKTPLPSGYSHDAICTAEVIDWAYANVGYTATAAPPTAPPGPPAPAGETPYKVIEIVEEGAPYVPPYIPPTPPGPPAPSGEATVTDIEIPSKMEIDVIYSGAAILKVLKAGTYSARLDLHRQPSGWDGTIGSLPSATTGIPTESKAHSVGTGKRLNWSWKVPRISAGWYVVVSRLYAV